ncbi:hypothetical protein N431DRAFT_372476 [Stipitochalara longipes BDJ]|nr:hypothetical protein N431DRAFT_372476 [Stipitochalara longipes BDJ]
MTEPMESDFMFVIQDPKERFSNETRTKIRKQAMRGRVGAPRHSLSPGSMSEYKRTIRRNWDMEHPLPPMPVSGLELLIKDRGIDPLDLSALASIHIGTVAAIVLSSEPSPLPGVLLCRQKSYFSFIPSHFGHTLALDDAFRCLITSAHSKLVPCHSSRRETILSNYSKALHSLQTAVKDSKTRYSTEVLCATAILAIFELLNSPNGMHWSQHIAGASRLIQLRGPSSFSSEFDKCLFVSLSYPICAQSLLNNEYCFLDDPTWTEVMKSAHIPSEIFTDRSKLGIDLMMLKPKISGLAKRTNHVVFMQETLEPKHFEAITADLRAARSRIVTWRRNFNTALLHADERTRKDALDFGKRYELLGVSLVIHIIVSRLLCSIAPNDRSILEEEVQNLALELKAVQGTLAHNRRAEFFFEQKATIGNAAIATHSYFEDVLDSGKIVELWRLETFFKAFGRKCCDGDGCCESEMYE